MDRPKRNILWLILGICGLSVLGWLVNTFPPENIPLLILFFVIIAGTVFFSSLFLFKIVRRAVLMTIGVVVWFTLRLLGLRELWYPLLLIPCLISLEILFQKR
ncbi:MAG: hypothetical protein NT149_01980 [Candidatus Gottesmanbacteria bacterium]|nr:hypothetical protein [Candidatus Gottesmanbacteria bacterium]